MFAADVGVAMLAGCLAERMLDTGVRGIGPVAGLLGYWAGARVWDAAGWSDGPLVAGVPVLPMFAGALAVCGVLKLIGLGAAGPRW
jgi:hypothetical protein